jgi:hypothetical protein
MQSLVQKQIYPPSEVQSDQHLKGMSIYDESSCALEHLRANVRMNRRESSFSLWDDGIH